LSKPNGRSEINRIRRLMLFVQTGVLVEQLGSGKASGMSEISGISRARKARGFAGSVDLHSHSLKLAGRSFRSQELQPYLYGKSRAI
jgi:hypothetical protein